MNRPSHLSPNTFEETVVENCIVSVSVNGVCYVFIDSVNSLNCMASSDNMTVKTKLEQV